MGFFDYLLFGALINSLRNSGRSNNTHSSFSTDSYNRGFEDGYDDCCIDHDDYGYHDDCSCGDYENDSFEDCNDDCFCDF